MNRKQASHMGRRTWEQLLSSSGCFAVFFGGNIADGILRRSLTGDNNQLPSREPIGKYETNQLALVVMAFICCWS